MFKDKENKKTSENKGKTKDSPKKEEAKIKKSELELAQDKIKIYEDKIKQTNDQLVRLQAEFENFRKRTEKENDLFRRYSDEKLIKALLPILDSFDLAIKNICKDENHNKKELEGLELLYSQFYSILENAGVKKIITKDQKFDLNLHEVMMTQPKEGIEAETILEEIQKGYMLKEKILRHSKVIIAK
jgi:molecular chaperone GrpE